MIKHANLGVEVRSAADQKIIAVPADRAGGGWDRRQQRDDDQHARAYATHNKLSHAGPPPRMENDRPTEVSQIIADRRGVVTGNSGFRGSIPCLRPMARSPECGSEPMPNA